MSIYLSTAIIALAVFALGVGTLLLLSRFGIIQRTDPTKLLITSTLICVIGYCAALVIPIAVSVLGVELAELPLYMSALLMIGIYGIGMQLCGIYSRDMGNTARVISSLSVCIIAAVLLECTVFNYTAFMSARSAKPTVQETAAYTEANGFNDIMSAVADVSTVTYDNLPACGDYTSFTFTPVGEKKLFKLSVEIKDANLSDVFFGVYTGNVLADGSAHCFNIAVSDKSQQYSMRLTMTAASGVTLSDITLGAAAAFHFSALRIILCLLISAVCLLLRHFRLYQVRLDLKKTKHTVILGITVLLCIVLISCMLSLQLAPKLTKNVAYPLTSPVSYCTPYQQQFDAFQKGQLNIDIEYTDELNKLKNPYDSSERSNSGYRFLWDRSYYQGKYYSYFGITPLLLCYYPYYFITGSLPAEETVCAILAIAAAVLSLCLIIAIGRRLRQGRPNLLLTLLCAIAFMSGSAVFNNQIDASFYSVPKLSALVFTVAFWLCSLLLYNKPRIVTAAVGAICVVLGIASRPTCIILMAAAAPLYVALLKNREIPQKKKLQCVAAFALPLLAGGAAIMWYNAIRFGSPFEFGAKYQLTVNDISNNSLNLSMLVPAIMHYFFQPYSISGSFPFFSTSTINLYSYTRYTYCAFSHGMLMMPACVAGLCAPFAIKRKSAPLTKWIVSLCLVLCVLFCFLSFCMGGTILSYSYEAAPLLLISAIILILRRPCDNGDFSYGLSVAILLCTIVLCLLIGLSLGPVAKLAPSLYGSIADIFSF